MRHTLQGFTMYIDGDDFGWDTETVQLPTMTPVTQDYQGGGMDLKVTQPMASLEALEATVKMEGYNPDILKRLAKRPNEHSRFTFRAAVLDQPSGTYIPHIAQIEGNPNFGSLDEMKRGEKAGLEFKINNILYYKYEVNADIVFESQAWPPKRVVNGVNQIGAINSILGY